MKSKSVERLRIHLGISFRTGSYFANKTTILTSLLLIPTLETALLLLIDHAYQSESLVLVGYLGALVTGTIAILNGVASTFATERRIGTLATYLLGQRSTKLYWLGKVIPPVSITFVSCLFQGAAVASLDHSDKIIHFLYFLGILPFCLLISGIFSLSISIISLLYEDPFLISNWMAFLTLTLTGVISKLSNEPLLFRLVSYCLPMSGTVQALREMFTTNFSLTSLMLYLLRDLIVCTFFMTWSYLAVARVKTALRKGVQYEF